MVRRTMIGQKMAGRTQQTSKRVTASWKTFQSHLRYLPAASRSRIKEAFFLGEEAHRGQARKSGDPHFSHCIAVADMLADMRADGDTIVAALLHDTVEDTPVTLSAIEQKFGLAVRSLVDGVTKLSFADLGGRLTLNEQTETLRKMFTLMQQDVRTIVIKIVDRLHNMQTVEFLPEEKQRVLAEETTDVYVKIADQLCMQDLRDELEELCLSILEPALYERLLTAREKNEEGGQQVVQGMEERIRAMRPSFPVEILHERKTWPKLRAQLEVGEGIVTGLSAVTGIFVCEDIDACYWMMGVLHQLWHRETLSFQDFINAPMINGYRGLHTTVILEDGTRVRCKIRTREMQDYAHRGVASRCFAGEALGVTRYLQWTERISPLAEGTSSRSEEFFAGLQSDILGESIVIHGPADQTVLVPKDATALDGAFYLFGNDALSIAAVRLDGREVPFQTPLHHAVSLETTPTSGKTVHREWLYWVRTGLATTKIRADLARRKRWKKMEEGRNMLQEVMAERKRGFLEEFDERSLGSRLQPLGLSSLDDAYVALAEGVFEPREVDSALFGEQTSKPTVAPSHFLIRFLIQGNDMETLRQLLMVYQKYNIHLGQIRIHPLLRARSERYLTLSVVLTPEECEELQQEITKAGGRHVSVESRSARWRYACVVGLLIVLWGLDPVTVKMLLAQGLSPFDFTALRFGVGLLLSGGYLLARQAKSREEVAKLRKVSPFSRALVLSGIGIFATALFTFLSLQYLSATTYIVLLTAALFLTFTLPPLATKQEHSPIFLAATVSSILLSILLLFFEEGSFLSLGPLAGLGAGLSFALYSVAGTRYQLQESIRTRYPSFLFYLTFFGFLCSLFLFPFTHFAILRSPFLLPAMLQVAVFWSLPYVLYFQLLKLGGAQTAIRYTPLEILITIVADAFLFNEWHPVRILLIIMVLAWVGLFRTEKSTVSC